VKFKTNNIDDILKQYNLEVVKQYRNNLFLLKTPINEAITISNNLYQLENVIFAHPDFIHTLHKR
jgi:hypothetical protein